MVGKKALSAAMGVLFTASFVSMFFMWETIATVKSGSEIWPWPTIVRSYPVVLAFLVCMVVKATMIKRQLGTPKEQTGQTLTFASTMVILRRPPFFGPAYDKGNLARYLRTRAPRPGLFVLARLLHVLATVAFFWVLATIPALSDVQKEGPIYGENERCIVSVTVPLVFLCHMLFLVLHVGLSRLNRSQVDSV